MTTAENLLDLARSQLGTCEVPLGSNRGTPYHKWYGVEGVPWCSIFTCWLFWKLGAQGLIHNVKSYYSGNVLAAGRKAGEEVPLLKARAGDIIVFDTPIGGITDHIGIVESRIGNTILTIEGNTGDCVKRRVRQESANCRLYFIRPKYAPSVAKEDDDMFSRQNLGMGKNFSTSAYYSGDKKYILNVRNKESEEAHVKLVIQEGIEGNYGTKDIKVPVSKPKKKGSVTVDLGALFENENLGEFDLDITSDRDILVVENQWV